MRHRLARPLLTVCTAVLFMASPALAQKPNSDIENIGNRDINRNTRLGLASVDQEIAMGQAEAREIEQHVVFLQDPVIEEYVNRIGQTLVRNSDAKIPFTIRVIDSPEINTLALPGGFLFVNKGLILGCDTEAELASMMAHGIAHVAARHAVEAIQKAGLLQIAAIPQTADGGIAGMAIQQAASIGVPLTFLAFARNDEEEADFLGLQYLYKAGYDPTAMVTFFEKLRAREAVAPKVSAMFSTHPETDERIRKTRQDIATYLPAREQAITTSPEFETVKARLAGKN